MEHPPTIRIRATDGVERWRDEAIGAEVLVAAGEPPQLPSHHHPTWQVGRVLEGSLRFDLGASSIVSEPGELMIVPPRCPHAISPVSQRAAYAQIEFPEDLLLRENARPRRTREPVALAAFERVLERSRRGDPEASRLLATQELAQALTEVNAQDEDGSHKELGVQDDEMEELRDYLHSVTDRAITLEELVEVASIPRATLLRRFKRQVHTSPTNYHLFVRVHAACALMDLGAAVGSAAIQTGFFDQSHLTRRARDVLAMGPAQWKNRRRI